MIFEYIWLPVQPTEAFPDRTSAKVPIIRVTIKYKDQSVDIGALIDSGSNFCVFPGDIGKDLGIEVDSGKKASAMGLGNTVSEIHFHNVVLSVGGHDNEIYAGFTDDVPIPILGQLGFFDHYDVRLNYLKDQIIINPY